MNKYRNRRVEKAGYRICATTCYEHRKGLHEENPWMTKIGSFPSKVLFKLTDYVPYFRNNLGHMLMVVAEKQ